MEDFSSAATLAQIKTELLGALQILVMQGWEVAVTHGGERIVYNLVSRPASDGQDSVAVTSVLYLKDSAFDVQVTLPGREPLLLSGPIHQSTYIPYDGARIEDVVGWLSNFVQQAQAIKRGHRYQDNRTMPGT